MNVLEINCLSPGHRWLQSDAQQETVLCGCPWLNLPLLYKDVNMFPQVEKTTYCLQSSYNITPMYYATESRSKKQRKRGVGEVK